MVDLLWDDAAFKKRVQDLAKARGLSLGAALEAAGITRRYFQRPQEGRSTNLIENLARTLGVSPAALAWPTIEELPSDKEVPIDDEKLRRITVAARMMTAQVAALIYVASEHSDAEPADLVKLVMGKLNHELGEPHTSSSSAKRK